MACFLVPTAEAVITTAIDKATGSDEKRKRSPFAKRLKWLNNMLWGGGALLAFEHIWHGEVTPWFPFLTNAQNSADRAEMLHEMSTSGMGMAAAVTFVWIAMVIAAEYMEKRVNRAACAVRGGDCS